MVLKLHAASFVEIFVLRMRTPRPSSREVTMLASLSCDRETLGERELLRKIIHFAKHSHQ